MQVSKFKLGLLGVLAMSTIAPMAQAEESAWGPITGGVTLTSDYRFRGISQSDRDAAAQGWLQYDHASGFFGNVWASTIDFNDEAAADSSIEVDLTAGYNFKIGAETDASVKAVYYWYADADEQSPVREYNYWEMIAGISHNFGKFSVTGELAYSPDYFSESGDAWAATAGASVPVMDSFLFFTGGLEASAHLGHQWIDDNARFGAPDYLYYDFGVSAAWESITVDLRWVDTDLETGECSGPDWCEGGVVLSVSADLPG
jgi:uncharacterized protein (TIGR02001 family)